MDDEWDAENFEPASLKPSNAISLAAGDKWEGEDEDDDVKFERETFERLNGLGTRHFQTQKERHVFYQEKLEDNWEDEEEEKKDEEKPEEVKAVQVKKKKKITEKIEEKERRDREEAARKLAAKEAMKNLTPEEKLAEKLRQQRLQEEADLQVTKETFGVIEPTESIDAMNPTTLEEFNSLSEALVRKLQPLAASVHFPLFVENLVRDITASLNANDLKKVKTTLGNLLTEKTKVEKEKTKKNKGKGKVRLKVEGENEYSAFGGANYDDYDDYDFI